ncbi:exonuclease domain-containing protein [Psittacicella gerlachiana]|uniref:DNA-directed DNA polymerase n=1 Tax=Psittacicella gerlachiana TaxID=2028574 RepID=A0A3A1Y962_9GAMM|nr:exonuclease domain-containing protein [Psittacicella gerlachiana]RIY34722.1 hypothetical protein CKF59_04975 [Psittacicella gerlachiana]
MTAKDNTSESIVTNATETSTRASSFSISEIEDLEARKRLSSANLYASDLDPDDDEEDDEDELTRVATPTSQVLSNQSSSSQTPSIQNPSSQTPSNQDSTKSQAQEVPATSTQSNQEVQVFEQDIQVPPVFDPAENELVPPATFEQEFQQSLQGRGEFFDPGAMIGGQNYGGEAGFTAPQEQGEPESLPFDYSIYQRYYDPQQGNTKNPPVTFSQNEEEYLAKRAIVENWRQNKFEESEFPLTRFEVELYYQYPELTPEPTQVSFQKHSLAWVKVIHEHKFDCYFMDTETTGMTREAGKQPSEGHRIITLGMVPMLNDKLDINDTASMVDEVFNPEEVEIEHEAYKVHGFKNKDLVDAPIFTSFAERFIRLVIGKVLIIHNAPFDLSFVNMELKRAGYNFEVEDICLVIDSLVLARSLYQGRASLDALSERFEVQIARELHGALLDSMILAEAYTRMLNSLQEEWFIDRNKGFRSPIIWNFEDEDTPPLEPELLALAQGLEVTLTEEELQRHEQFCEEFNIQNTYSLMSQARLLKLQQEQEALAEQEEEQEAEAEYEEEEQELATPE